MYAHINPITLKPFYIGKGKGDRGQSTQHRSSWWNNYTNKYGFVSITLVDGIDNKMACEIEKQYIKKYGFIKSGGLLINQTNGGEGGNTFDPIGGTNWNTGKTGVYKPETIEKMRAYRLGKKHNDETKIKVLAGLEKAKNVKLGKRYKVECLLTGKIWNNRVECINDLGISLELFKQRIWLGKKLKYIKNEL